MSKLIKTLQVVGYAGNVSILGVYVSGLLNSLNFFVTLVLMAQVGALLVLAGALKDLR